MEEYASVVSTINNVGPGKHFVPKETSTTTTPAAPRCGTKFAQITIGDGDEFQTSFQTNTVMATHRTQRQQVDDIGYFGFSFAADTTLSPKAKTAGTRTLFVVESDVSYREIASLRVSQDGTKWQFFTDEKLGGDADLVKRWDGDLVPGAWVDFQLEIKWSNVAADGYFKLSVNGGIAQTIAGATLQPGCKAGSKPYPAYFNVGASRTAGSDTGTEVYLFDCFREADTLDSLLQVVPYIGNEDLKVVEGNDANPDICVADNINGYQVWEDQIVVGCGVTTLTGSKITTDWDMAEQTADTYGTINFPINGLSYASNTKKPVVLRRDISTSKTLTLMYKSNKATFIQLRLATSPHGGHHYRHDLPIHAEATELVLNLADFAQPSWADAIDFDLAQAYSFTFAFVPSEDNEKLELELTKMVLDKYSPPCAGETVGTEVDSGDMPDPSVGQVFGATPSGFGAYIEGAAVDKHLTFFAVNYGAGRNTIGQILPNGDHSLFWESDDADAAFNSIRFAVNGDMFVGDTANNRVHKLAEGDKAVVTTACQFPTDVTKLPNDLALAQNGIDLFASSMDYAANTGQIWYCNTATGEVKQVADDTWKKGNGIALSPDDKTLYLTEHDNVLGTNYIWAYDVGTAGDLTGKRKFFDFESDVTTDGMRCDTEGNLFATRVGIGKVMKLSPTGALLYSLETTFTHPTNLEFGGWDGKTLFVIGRCGKNTKKSAEGAGCVNRFEERSAPGRLWHVLRGNQHFGASMDFAEGIGNIVIEDLSPNGVAISYKFTGKGAGMATKDYKLHLHAKGSIDRTDCATAGGHYDPRKVEGDDYYCDPNDLASCWAGDLSGKFGKLVMDGSVVTVEDTSISFDELRHVSIVLHDTDGSRMACSEVKDVFIVRIDDLKVKGYILFTDSPNGVLVQYMLSANGHSATDVHKWHLHEKKGAFTPTDCDTTDALYDPYDVGSAGDYNCNSTDYATCYMGDLSGKFGYMQLDGLTHELFDYSIRFNELSQLSLVIHDTDSSRMGCGEMSGSMIGVTGETGTISAGSRLEASMAAVLTVFLALAAY